MITDGGDARYVVLADEGQIETRTVRIDEQSLTLKVEASYWRALEDICRREEMSVEELVSDIRHRLREQSPGRGRGDPSSSPLSLGNALRVFVVGYFRQAATEAGHLRAGHGRGDLFLQTPVDPAPAGETQGK